MVAVVGEVPTPRGPHAGLRREVIDLIGALEQRREVQILQASLDKAKASVLAQDGDVLLLHRSRVVVGEAVDPDDLGTIREEALRDV